MPPAAALVCPSAPFLAPRLLRGPLPVALLRLPCPTAPAHSPRCQAYATKKSHVGPSTKPVRKHWVGKGLDARDVRDGAAALLSSFEAATRTPKLHEIMNLYPHLLELRNLPPQLTLRLTQALHTLVRQNPTEYATPSSSLLLFVDRVIQDIRQQRLPAHSGAGVHLLGLLKEARAYDRGHQLWLWLSQQDGRYVNQFVYGAAIELLAFSGKQTLEALEALYQDGLSRFPGTFASYHFSPDAILPDRNSPLDFINLPISLLQGIMTARLLYGDWVNAYVALDTALRLCPTGIPTRMYELFMVERPLPEAYTVFLLACRHGGDVKPAYLTTLLAKMRLLLHNCDSLSGRLMIIRAMANAVYAFLQTRATLYGPHVGVLFHSFSLLIPAKDSSNPWVTEVRNAIVGSVHKMVTSLVQAGFPPYPQVFTALLALADKSRSHELYTVIAHDIKASGVELNPVGRRVALMTAGRFRDTAMIDHYWTQIASLAEGEGNMLERRDWEALAKACVYGDQKDYFHQQKIKLLHTMDEDTESVTSKILTSSEKWRLPFPITPMDVPAFTAELKAIEEIMSNIVAVHMSGQPLDIRTNPFFMFMDSPRQPLASEADLRAVYDELTTDPHQPEPKPDPKAKPVTSPSGIPLGELRFKNWCTIIELMADVHANEAEFQRRVSEATAKGEPVESVSYPLYFRKDKGLVVADQEEGDTDTKGRLKDLVRRLRNLQVPTQRRPLIHLTPSPPSDRQAMRNPSIRYDVHIGPSHGARTPPSEASTQAEAAPPSNPSSQGEPA